MSWGASRVRLSVVAGAIMAALAAALVLMSASARAQAPVQPYGTNDAGGFHNVLPSGENGTDNAAQLAQFQLNGTYPPHYADQLPLYANLIYGSPTLTNEQIPDYFKDATFGVKEGEVASEESPRSDVTIQRDSAYGVPHVYGSTRAGVMFGAGYAAAADRLFLMDVLRHTGRAELSSFVGGSEGNRAMDRTQWMIAPYTEADLQSQLEKAPVLYGAKGAQVVEDVENYVAGINAYVNAALLDPNKLPAEYAALGKLPTQWKATDVIAEASLIGGIFGKGGGAEVRSALALEALEHKFGMKAGRLAWKDFREHNDPEAPVTISKPFPYETNSPFSKTGLAMPDPGSVELRAGRLRPLLDPLLYERLLLAAGDRHAGPDADPQRRLARFAAVEIGARRPRADVQLGARQQAALDRRSLDRSDGPAGRLLQPADPDGGGSARSRHRRARRGVPGRQPVRRARPRPRLRLERHDRHLGQRRHLRRGPLPGRIPLPLQGLLRADGKARTRQRMDAERLRPDGTRQRNADRLPNRARHRVRARHGQRPGRRLRQRAHDLLPRGRLRGRLLRAQRTRLRDRARTVHARGLGHQLRLQLGLRRREPHRLLPLRRLSRARSGHLAGLPDPGDRRIRLAGI